jgi:lipopolysaccharide biosynthesis glycosyltransferase
MIKIFIGTSEYEDRWIEQIYLYSLFKNTDEELDITFLRPSMFKDWNKHGWGTPFTCFRYAVPELCNFKGKAIYTDVDQLNLRDISALYNTDLEGCTFAMAWDGLHDNGDEWSQTPKAKGWFCDSVMLIDCEKAKEFIKPIKDIKQWPSNYKHHFIRGIGNPHKENVKGIIKELDPRWNSFDGRDTSWYGDEILPLVGTPQANDVIPKFDLDEIFHIHFTSMSTQPWHPIYSPWGKASYQRDDIAAILWDYARKVKMIANPEEF